MYYYEYLPVQIGVKKTPLIGLNVCQVGESVASCTNLPYSETVFLHLKLVFRLVIVIWLNFFVLCLKM